VHSGDPRLEFDRVRLGDAAGLAAGPTPVAQSASSAPSSSIAKQSRRASLVNISSWTTRSPSSR
jgi:hypothetical protein